MTTAAPARAPEGQLLALAYGLGFDLAGIARLGPADTRAEFEAWLAAGHHGEMQYLARGAELRADTTRPEPGMQSAIVVGMNYGGTQPAGPIARYARGDDYHRVLWDRLDTLGNQAREVLGPSVRTRSYCDTGPILERDLARRAGLGWFGKNTMLINPTLGSFFFIGALFLDVALTPSDPFEADRCGSCTRCLEACPTDAFVAPRVMDARKCISYLTIELKGEIPADQRAGIGEHLYGCDDCQSVCPWNVKFSQPPADDPPFRAQEFIAGKDSRTLAQDILALDQDGFSATFRNSAMKRAKLVGLRRNAAVVLTNATER